VPAIASAQWAQRPHNGYYDNGACESTIKRVKSQARHLEDAFDHNNSGRYGGGYGGDWKILPMSFKMPPTSWKTDSVMDATLTVAITKPAV